LNERIALVSLFFLVNATKSQVSMSEFQSVRGARVEIHFGCGDAASGDSITGAEPPANTLQIGNGSRGVLPEEGLAP
jgi:hypothetical protein